MFRRNNVVTSDLISASRSQQAFSRFRTRQLRADTRHAARVDAVRSAAIVREHLGQAAQYCLVEGQHEISVFDRVAGRLRTFTGDSLADAIGRAELEGEV